MAANQSLSGKEATLFRQVIKCYEEKTYKQGIKTANQILKKNPKHADTIAMKSLILNSQGNSEEAFRLCKEALTLNMKSHICWHVYGLLYRSVKNYEEAIKAYKFALRFDPESAPILRDLAILQVQTRDYKGYIASRKTMLNQRPQLRQNWTALATANHLAGNLADAERVLKTYEDTLKTPPVRTDLEHSEAIMYKIEIIAESGDIERALKELEGPGKKNLDHIAYLENRAKYLLALKRNKEAAAAYCHLIERNPDYGFYYEKLIEALGIQEDYTARKVLFEEYAAKFPRSSAPVRVPLDFLEGDDFKTAVEAYITNSLNRGIPSTFHNLKGLYTNEFKKNTIEAAGLAYLEAQKAAAEQSDSKTSSGLYFLALHYKYHISRDLEKAMKYIEEALEIDAQSTDFHMTKARIIKHTGDLDKAAKVMDYARSLDVKDRYINTKAVKYLLRNNQNEKALDTISLFTRPDTLGGPIADLLEMQCLWFLIEDARAFIRNNNIGMALKRIYSVTNIFDVWQEDQIDFHTFCLRKGQMRAYVDMIRWADKLREHPFYSTPAIDAINIYVKMHDKPEPSPAEAAAIAEEAKKAAKKAKKIQEKTAQEVAAKAAKTDPNKSFENESAKVDQDPLGLKLAETKTPLDKAMMFVSHLLQSSPKLFDAQIAAFDVFIRQNKWLQAAKCLKTAKEIDATNSKVHDRFVQFFHLATPALAADVQVAQVVKLTLEGPADLKAYNNSYISENAGNSLALLAGARATKILGDQSAAEDAIFKVLADTTKPNVAIEGLKILNEFYSTRVEEYRAEAAKKFANVTRLA